MNIRDFEYIIAVAKMGNFTKAARFCSVSQPTLSAQIKKVEELLQVEIFERNQRKVLLTEVGQAIVQHCELAIKAVGAIRELAEQAKNPLAGRFNLGVFPTLGPYLLPRVVSHVREALPSVRLLLVEEKSAELMQQLQDGALDAALLALPLEDSQMHYRVLFEDPFYLAVWKQHRLARRKSVSLDDVSKESLLLLEEGHCLRGQALDFCERVELWQDEFRATSLETLKQMVRLENGVTLVPRIACCEHDGLCYLPFKRAKPLRTIVIAWRKTSTKLPVIEVLADLVRDCGASPDISSHSYYGER